MLRLIIVGCGEVVGTDQLALGSEQGEQALVVDAEPERPDCMMSVGSVDEEGDALILVEMHGSTFWC